MDDLLFLALLDELTEPADTLTATGDTAEAMGQGELGAVCALVFFLLVFLYKTLRREGD